LNNEYTLPPSNSIKYNGWLIGNNIIDIDEAVLLEFGKYFLHGVTYYYNEKWIKEITLLLEKSEEDEEMKSIYQNKNFTTKPKNINAFKRNDMTVSSFRPNRRENNLSNSNMQEGYASVSVSAMRK